MENLPLISVLCSSYNHEKYVAYFITSLIKQTYKNWELIIIDDCSTDNNVAEIKKFTDERIHFYQQNINSGSSIVTTRAFSLSKGDIIVDCASDDALREDYFAKLIEIFDQKDDVGVVYSSLSIMNNKNQIKGHWNLPQKNRIELLQQMFFHGNYLFSPGMAVRRNFYKILIPMNFAIVQHQDYQWHVKLLLHTNCQLLDDYYVFYRFNEVNSISLSAKNTGGDNRYKLEEDYLMDTFLSIKDIDFCAQIILLDNYDCNDKDFIPFLLGKAALTSNVLEKRQWGYKTLINYFENPENFNKINNHFTFEFKDLLRLSEQNYYSYSEIFKDKLEKYDNFMQSKLLKKFSLFYSYIFSSLISKFKSKKE